MSKKSRFPGPMTAEKLLELLESDPEWVAKQEAREFRREVEARQFRAEEAPIVEEIIRAGLNIRSTSDLVSTKEPYPEAIPVLLRHLAQPHYSDRIRGTLARALTVKGYPEILPAMIAAYRWDPDNRLNGPKWAKGNAIEVLFDDRYAEEIAELALDPAHGEARDLLVRALGKSRKPVADAALRTLLSDPEMGPYAETTIERRDRRRRKRLR